MGNFYTNITLYNADRTNTLQALKGRRAAISPTVDNFTVIWDEESESQDLKILEAVSSRLSRELICPAWAILNHDDDLLLYVLFVEGEKLDHYNSLPEYFGESGSQPNGGNAALLAKTFGAESEAEPIERILRDRTRYAFAVERHQALIEALAMPSFAVGMGYTYISNGERPPGLDKADDITFPD